MITERDRTAVAVNHVVPHAENSHGRALDRRRSIRRSLIRISQSSRGSSPDCDYMVALDASGISASRSCASLRSRGSMVTISTEEGAVRVRRHEYHGGHPAINGK